MKILTVVGARPQFVKAAAVSHKIRQIHTEVLIHTGQHYDANMSEIFFSELGIPLPDENLEIGSGPHGKMTGEMLIRIEEILLRESPDCVLLYGDTNSTLAGALAACKLHIPIAHVEAGLRSFNRRMPEEHNRVLTDHMADLLFCPSRTAIANLRREGIEKGAILSGDVMYDAALHFLRLAEERDRPHPLPPAEREAYFLATVHRPANTDDPNRLLGILTALSEMETPVVCPLHPRTRARIAADARLEPFLSGKAGLRILQPVGYLDMLLLERDARAILTDSGGMQKEAYFLGTPCITLREETEWTETIEEGWNVLVGSDPAAIRKAAANPPHGRSGRQAYGDGNAAENIAQALSEWETSA